MQKIKDALLIISIIINIFLAYKIYSKSVISSKEPIVEVDSLELITIENERDSISKEIDTVFIQLKVTEKEYEEKYNNILSNSTNDDYIFFTDYLERNRERLDSINNSLSIKEN